MGRVSQAKWLEKDGPQVANAYNAYVKENALPYDIAQNDIGEFVKWMYKSKQYDEKTMRQAHDRAMYYQQKIKGGWSDSFFPEKDYKSNYENKSGFERYSSYGHNTTTTTTTQVGEKRPRDNEHPQIEPVSKKPATAQQDQDWRAAKRAFDEARNRQREEQRISAETQARIMAEPEGSGNGPNNTDVTLVSPYAYAFEGIPKYYTTILPYEATVSQTSLATTQGQRNSMFQIRMNSIYDVLRTTTAWVSNPNPVADSPDATVNIPYWRGHWDQYYEYWTVLECRYKIRVWNTTKVNDRDLGVFWGYTGIQQPPLTESGGAAITDTDLTFDTFRRWKNFKQKLVKTMPADAGAQIIPRYADDYCVQIYGVYKPGDGVHEVVEDDLAQRWVRGNAVPKEQNNLSIILTRAPQTTGTTAMSFEMRVELEYVVQYKDQKEIWQFPRPNATPNFAKVN